MLWGPSAKLLANDADLQARVKTVQKTGVKFNACVVCSDDYGVSKELESMGIELIHTGEMLTEALQGDETKVITF